MTCRTLCSRSPPSPGLAFKPTLTRKASLSFYASAPGRAIFFSGLAKVLDCLQLKETSYLRNKAGGGMMYDLLPALEHKRSTTRTGFPCPPPPPLHIRLSFWGGWTRHWLRHCRPHQSPVGCGSPLRIPCSRLALNAALQTPISINRSC